MRFEKVALTLAYFSLLKSAVLTSFDPAIGIEPTPADYKTAALPLCDTGKTIEYRVLNLPAADRYRARNFEF